MLDYIKDLVHEAGKFSLSFIIVVKEFKLFLCGNDDYDDLFRKVCKDFNIDENDNILMPGELIHRLKKEM